MRPRLLTRLFIVALLLVAMFIPVTAEASNGYTHIENGYYLKYNASGQHDGWWYRKNNCCHYYRHSQVPAKGVAYSANWKSDLVKALEKAKDTELFLEAIKESGLQVNPNSLPSEYQGYARGQSTIMSGYGYVPYAAQGQSIMGLAAYAPNIGQVDIEALLRTQQRTTERQAENAAQANNYLTDRIGQLGAEQANIAKLQVATAAIIAAAQTSTPPRIEQHQWEAGSGGQVGGQAGGQATTGQTPGDAIALVRAANVMSNKCVSCHGPNEKKGGLDLSAFATWDDATAQQYEPKIAARITSRDPAKQMPPPDKPQLDAADLRTLLNVLPE